MVSLSAGTLLRAAFLLSLLTTTFSLPALPHPVSRIAVYDDIPATYRSIYAATDLCPSTLTLPVPTIDARQVAVIPIPSITENSAPCSGDGPLSFVSEATVEQEGLLTALRLAGFRAALDANTNANTLVNVSSTSMLVGWHGVLRTCQDRSYDEQTIYFIINEDRDFRISFNNGDRMDIVTIPPNLKSLLIIGANKPVCLLVDPASNPGQDATVTPSSGDGQGVTTVLQPFGVEPATVPGAPPAPDAPPAPVVEEELIGSPEDVLAEMSMEPTSEFLETSTESGFDDQSDAPDVPGAEGVQTIDEDTTPEVAPSPTADAGAQEDDGSACFPAEATVRMENGERRRMDELKIGDKIMDANGQFSDVVFFTHRHTGMHRFSKITTNNGSVFVVSPGHYVYANGLLRAAKAVREGDSMYVHNFGSDKVLSVESVFRRGLYNPQTASGTIVVDDFRASTYTTAVEPRLAHAALMAPIRFLYGINSRVTDVLAGLFDHGSPLLAAVLPSGERVVDAL